MATTYAKIRATLAEMVRKPSWTPQQLKADLVNRDKIRKENTFQTRQRGTNRKRPLSDDAFARLFEFMIELGLITRDAEENFQLPKIVRTQLEDEERYKRFLSRRVTELLEQNDINMTDLRKAAQRINYPDVRDPETILENLKRDGRGDNDRNGDLAKSKVEKMTAARFTQILFLLAIAAQSAERHMRIFYDFK